MGFRERGPARSGRVRGCRPARGRRRRPRRRTPGSWSRSRGGGPCRRAAGRPARAGEHLPVGDLGGAVPARGDAVTASPERSRDRARRLGRLAHATGSGSRGRSRRRPGSRGRSAAPLGVELRDAPAAAEADERVAVRRGPASCPGRSRGCRPGASRIFVDGRAHRLLVRRSVSARERGADLRRGLVVEQRERAVRLAARVVLPGEAHALAEREVAAAAAEPPDHVAGLAVELVDRPRVARGDQQVAVAVDVDRVDVEVVVGTSAVFCGIPASDSVEPDVVEAAPLPHAARRSRRRSPG